MKHLLALLLFASLVSVIFGITGREEPAAQWRYGAGVFAKFVGVALLLGWLLYLFPL